MSRRRVLFVSHWSSCHGGSSIVFLQLISGLNRERFEPIALCPEDGELPRRLAELDVPVVIQRNSAFTKSTAAPFLKDVLWYSRWLKHEGIHLVHCHSGGWRRSVLLAARIRGVPFVKHLQNYLKNDELVSGVRGDFGYRWANRIIACSDAIGDTVRQQPTLRERTVTIHNAVDISAFEGLCAESEAERQCQPVIGFAGQIIPRKGLDVLIHSLPLVLQRVPGALLKVVGCAPPGEEEYEQECRALVQSLNLESHVEFIGYSRHIAQWMKRFDVFVLPTRAEAFGIVNIEAMAAGCPVVATDVGGIPEIITGPDVGTIVPVDEVGAVAAGIVRYLTDRDLANRVGANARARVKAHFGVETMLQRIESVYESVLAESKAGAT